MTEDTSPKATKPSPAKKVDVPKKKMSMTKILVVLVVLLIVLFVWAEKSRRDTAKQLEVTNEQLNELQQSTEGSAAEEEANKVRENIAALIDLPAQPQPTVAKINDIDRLREANEFFASAQNGDYLVLTGNRAILYNLERNIILDVAPFKIQQASPSPGAEADSSTQAGSATEGQ